ncbi:uncharacterized protein LOC112057413 [Bicyclus anynana]|uniref:Uncharacterized protein LOC112057413 n=1 Tax=Bicyclus anynana TaxID=110368 RepID=A0ABM3LSW0_BICAN|nr:uncharacterized protein LOC112057413 [Bicyclus anynana]
MRCEIPILRRCCFCFPLRYGLLVWAYIKLVLSLIFLGLTIAAIIFASQRRKVSFSIELPIVLVVTTVDIVFSVLFIISAHQKDYKKMRIFYWYNIAILSLNLAVIGLYIANGLYYMFMSPYVSLLTEYFWYMIAPAIAMTFLLLLSQGYLILLVRSEFLKLKNNSHFEFVNNAADEKCTGNLDFDKDIPV